MCIWSDRMDRFFSAEPVNPATWIPEVSLNLNSYSNYRSTVVAEPQYLCVWQAPNSYRYR